MKSKLSKKILEIISETNGISINDTLELLSYSYFTKEDQPLKNLVSEFQDVLVEFHKDNVTLEKVLAHPVAESFFEFFKLFPLPYYEEHIHLTGSLDAEFIYPRIKKLLEGDNKKIYEEKIKEVYGEDALPIKSQDDVDKLIRLKDGQHFKEYLRILYLAKLVLHSREAHREAAYSMAKALYTKYNVGHIRLKFTLSRMTKVGSEQIPGIEGLKEEDVVLGLYQGFKDFQKELPDFKFILSPSFRKEVDFFDDTRFASKEEHFNHQVKKLLEILNKHPELKENLSEIDTVGDEKELYRKAHFANLKEGMRKLQYRGFKIRSHHGETWHTLRRGIQSVDNAMNIWHIDTLEHGLSLGINPNFYFHRLYQTVISKNLEKIALTPGTREYKEIEDMQWRQLHVKEKLLAGQPLNLEERIQFIKTKFHTAREIEHYQHDVLNRIMHKQVSLVTLPSSNTKLTEVFPDYKDHPFSWWEKKGVQLGVGTDNYITLSTNFIKEMLILLFSDPDGLKITKLLMVVTRESRRPYISHLLWKMRKKYLSQQP